MNLSTLTLDERERLAYAEGYTETAALLAQTADLDNLREVIDEISFSLDKMKDARDSLIDERDELEDEMHKVREDRDEAQELAKTYRAALMALEAEVSPALREFIREVLQ